MKKTVLASILTLAATLATVSSYGQGSVIFENYDFGPLNAPVTFGTASPSFNGHAVTVGEAVGSEFSADLLYSLDGGTTYTLLTQGNAGAGTAYPTAFGGTTDGDLANGAGYFLGPTVTIPGYSSGPVSFIVEAFNGSSYAAAAWRGQSAAFVDPALATGQSPASEFPGGSMQGFTVNPVPEPTIFALAGLGAAALMAIRRKK